MKISRRATLGLAAAAAIAVTGGSAFAYWTQSGTGSATAGVGSAGGIYVVQDNVVRDLYPGGAPVALSGHFENGNTSAVKVGGVTARVTEVRMANNDATKPACTPADFAITGTTPEYLVPKGKTFPWEGLGVSMLATDANQDNCKDAVIVITYAAAPPASAPSARTA